MQNTVIYPGAILELQSTLMHINRHKVFLVTGKNSFENCGAKEKINWLYKDYEVTHFDDFQTNPDSSDVTRGVKFFNKSKCQVIVSIGGGSVIDMAKLINYYHKSGISTIGEKSIINDKPELVTHVSIPTTAGSGAEATHFAVMYIGNTKYSIAHHNLIPNYSLIDPELHYSQTPYQKAVSGADALAQAIESFWSIQSTEESRQYSERALGLVWNNLPYVVHNGDKLAHLSLAIGANLAGKAINIAKTTAPHALAYGFTKYANLPHGHAVSLSLPYFIKLHNGKCKKDVHKSLSKIDSIINSQNKELDKCVIDFLDNIELNIRFNQLNISSDLFDLAIQKINFERLANNPDKIDTKVLKEIFTYNNTL